MNNKEKIAKLTEYKEWLESRIKEGRVLSAKNEQDMRDAQDHIVKGIALHQGVLDQVTGSDADKYVVDTDDLHDAARLVQIRHIQD
jgi:hypothetical protein